MFKKRISIILILALVFTMVMPLNQSLASEEAVNITIVHTNDTHARLEEGNYDGMGFAKIATKLKQLETENNNILLLDAGDAFHGNPLATIAKGESVMKVFNKIGYDGMVLGNHDFNYGKDRAKELMDISNFDILASNVVEEDSKNNFTKKYIIKEIDGVKIGIFGLATPETKIKSHPRNTEGLEFLDPVEASRDIIKELEDKSDVIIVLSHLGMGEDTKEGWRSDYLAKNVNGIDLIIDGHSHTNLPQGMIVDGTLIVSAYEYDKALGIVKMTYKDGDITMDASLFTKEDASNIEKDEEILNLIKEIKDENSIITSQVVGNTPSILVGEREVVRRGESNLANLITDSMKYHTNADIAITNGGGIRASIKAGDITKSDVLTVLPFGNYVITKEIKGEDIKNAIEYGVKAYPETNGGFPQVSGLTYEFNPDKPEGQKVLNIKVNGRELDNNKMYVVATNDFMAAGGDGYEMFKKYPELKIYKAMDEILVDYIAEFGTENISEDSRIIVTQQAKADKIEVEKVEEIKEEKEEQSVEMDTYNVKKDDVLWKIAEKFGITWERLAEINELKNPHLIFIGQKLLVPQN
ncbi:5'-nucleotidase C-terminal domain-containing protein [Clostridiisalibacter paucivorans]|uniref:5'-nucleotidase C-terminal domain-containing protein n=1 Tax=Clostridiisalibacter paucivorans TaxID=408753 RepID=UPI000686F7B7|nr:5'-nucleotidase C-terminal domain-containing protein [Clostridiisalibacter paucivorans]